MICQRCHKPVPDNQISCDCFVLHAQQEKLELAVKRFLAGEVLLFARGGHVFPERRNSVSLCGSATIVHHDEKKTKDFGITRMPEESYITCPECQSRLTSDV